MDAIKTTEDLLLWKKDDVDGIKKRIAVAVSDSSAGGEMKEILYKCTENTGKMIRPLIILMAAEDYSETRRDELLWGAAAGEMLHIASLLLDDIIDGAEIRRGKPSVQAEYGKPAALCAGNYLMATGYSCLLERGYTETACELIRATQLVCDGEMVQDIHRFDTDITEETYLHSLEGKTAAAFSFSCAISSRISGHDERTQRLMKDFGSTVGLMFQIRDDILDWTKDEKTLGKPACGDFINGTYTLPAIYAFRDERYGKELISYAKRTSDLDARDVEKIKELVVAAKGVEYACSYLAGLSETALGYIRELPSSTYTSALKMIVRMLVI